MLSKTHLVEPMPEMHEMVVEVGGNDLDLCFQCGQCTAICPWGRVRDHNVRNMLHKAQMGITGFEDEIWFCTTCNHCKDRCHRGVDIPEVIRSARRLIIEGGKVDEGLRLALSSLDQKGNPFLEDEQKRNAWLSELDVPAFESEKQYLLYTCCENSFQDHNREVTGTVVKLLNKLNVSFGSFGSQEHCCGDVALKTASDDLFTKTAAHNIRLFTENKVQEVLTTSPHCMQTIGDQYKAHGGDYQIQHLVTFLHELLEQGKLTPTNTLDLKVAYHDPCYLGRHAGIYDEPRTLIGAIPGVEVVEMSKNREEALCCGGGAGRMFQDTHMAERFANTRLEQAVEAGANVLVTACPYCICNFDEAVLNLELQEQLQIMDLTELLWEAVK